MTHEFTLRTLLCVFVTIVLSPNFGHAEDEFLEMGAVERDEDGILCHRVLSLYQDGKTEVRVLLPDQLDESRRYRVVYVLPVEAGRDSRYGDGLREVKIHNLHNIHEVIFVSPTFSRLPWYADHSASRLVRQETHFQNVVIPLIEKTYPASIQPRDRLLLGFSKSGWGSWSLLLRHTDKFGRALAWDAPLMMDDFDHFGARDIFGTPENFENYHLANLLRINTEALRREKRLILTGNSNFRDHHILMRVLLEDLEIPHDFRLGSERPHDWHSGWVTEGVELLLGDAGTASR